MTEPTPGRDDCDCKVGAVIDRRGLVGLHDELVARWTGQAGERESLRTLADRFNRAVLRAEVDEAGVEVLDGEVANAYRLLTDDDASSGERTQARNRLTRQGVDVEGVESDFVSHQTVHTHLRECAGADHEPSAAGSAERTGQTLRALQSRTQAVTTDALARLRDGDRLALEEFSVLVNVGVVCERCGAHHDVASLLDAGGCDCQRD